MVELPVGAARRDKLGSVKGPAEDRRGEAPG
jgi:hypothetical protein